MKSIVTVICVGLALGCTHSLPKAGIQEGIKPEHGVVDITMKFDHTYNSTSDGSVYQGLLQRGFISIQQPVNHPGQNTCEFINFRPVAGLRSHYLEFCFHNPSLPKDRVEFGKDPRDLWTGFSLKTDQSLELYLQNRKQDLAEFGLKLEHKNYDWAKDNTSRLPGWNFLNFDKDPIHGIFIWVTEYEKTLVENPKPQIVHPNSALRVLGFIWKDIPAKGKADLQRITQGTLQGSRLILADGTWIQFVESNSTLGTTFANKTTPYVAVVLEVEKLKTFQSLAKPDEILSFQGQDAARIKLENSGWDILAVEAKDGSAN